MKKLLLSIITIFVFIQTNKAQCPGCVIDQSCSVNPPAPALCPAILPDGLQNNPYDENVTFYMPAQFQTSGFNVTLNQITVLSITGMPQGLNWQTSASPSNIFYPSTNPPSTERGCVKICGTPTVFGQFNIIVSVVAEVSTPIGNVTQNESFSLPILITSPPGANSSFAYNPSFGCAPLNVDFEATLVPNGLEEYTYDWDFDNGNTSTLQLPPTQTYAVADTYYVSLNTKKYVYRLSSVSISATGTNWCGDVEEPNYPFLGCTASPDMYFEFTNNGATQTSGTIDDQNSATFSNINYILTDPLFSLQFFDEDLISGNDNLGNFLYTVTGPGTFSLSTNEVAGTFTIDTVFSQQFTDIDTVIVFPMPAIPSITASGNLNFCQGDSVTLSVNANNSTFQWYLNDTTIMIGEVNPDLTINTSGAYSVVETNQYGCNSLSANDTVIVYPIPPSPNLFVNGGSINSSATGTLQWFFNGVAIPGANQANLLYGDTGVYTLTVTTANGCINSSSLNVTTPSGVYQINNNQSFSIYPNPVKNTLNIRNQNATNIIVNIAITDLSGAVVYQENQVNLNNTPVSIDISTMSNGVYFVSIFNNQIKQQQKIVVIK
jgi:PKD repeat protein